jgi:hypothetical protein
MKKFNGCLLLGPARPTLVPLDAPARAARLPEDMLRERRKRLRLVRRLRAIVVHAEARKRTALPR